MIIPNGYTLEPWEMKAGLKEKIKENGINASVKWAKTNDNDKAYSIILDMLECDIPVVASHYNKNWTLPYYSLDKYDFTLSYKGDMGNHYFTITGIIEVYEENRYVKYARISSWGREYYINLSKYLNRLSYFNNLLCVY